MAYNIIIDEAQRQLIHQALAHMNFQALWPNELTQGDSELLCAMIKDLEKDEAAEPGCVHGLCL